MTEGTKEAIYLQNFLNELGIQTAPTILYNDNQGAAAMIKNPVFHARTKHIDARHHFIRDVFELKRIEPRYMPTEDMPADTPTKSLFGPKHSNCTKMLNIAD